ncbi:MAG: PP2C family protein-serine/threonine phosphatase, partial [Planctomycetota bacterium]
MSSKPNPSSSKRFWLNSLSFRLALAINLTAIVVLLVFWGLDYKREYRVHMDEQVERLKEEAKILRIAQQEFTDAEAFQHYVDAYCRQMGRHVSPGHHILVTDQNGEVIARAHIRSDADLEAKMSVIRGEDTRTFVHDDQEYMAVGLAATEDSTILMAQSLAPVKRVIRRQAISRALSAAVLVALIIAVTNYLLLRWVRRPIQSLVDGVEIIRQGRFDHRIDEFGTTEFSFLADGFNRMSGSLATAEQRRLLEMEKARRIHLGLLPPKVIRSPGFTVTGQYIPTDRVGGDYYDVLEYPDGRWLFVIADVSGHGVPAALVMAMLKSLIRQAVRQRKHLNAIAELTNQELELLVGMKHFVTCMLVLYDPLSGELEYLNCGHEPAVVVNEAAQLVVTLDSTGMPLGVVRDANWEIEHLHLEPGDRLYLLTDGLAEVSDRDDNILGRKKLIQIIQNTAKLLPSCQMEAILQQVADLHENDTFA